MKDRILRTVLWVLGVLTVLVVLVLIYARAVSNVSPPDNVSLLDTAAVVQEPVPGLRKLGNNWFRHSDSGLYELYVEGEPFERGLANGKLTRALVQYQEEAFTSQIQRLVPNGFYRGMLKYFIGWFNRDLPAHVIDEYKEEIYGVSQAASHAFDDIGEPYERILNYHAAHDIGHALQNMSLVGCTSFATWNERSQDSTLIVGRNFDFYVGDDFARDKIIAFYKPVEGYGFMMITFGGMTGVVSGMNDQGLTVTINAAKSDIPSASATPVSLVAREILQHASNIQEAYAIAQKRQMFVAESFLIGSAKDRKAAVIEKGIDDIDLVESSYGQIISTNHFRGEKLGGSELNQEHIRTSASPYRYARVAELLARVQKNTVASTAEILRDQKGLEDADIGMGNEKLVNQLVAHHAVIFQPEQRLVWISTAPWQLGKFVCYDLAKVLAYQPTSNREIYETDRTIRADSFTETSDYQRYLKFHVFRFPFAPRTDLNPDSIVAWNPHSYHSYLLAGDYYLGKKEWGKAADMFSQGLKLEVATLQEREYMARQVAECKEKLK
ncbi:MAG TPA: C45 family peptidase [Chryseolinea sp.]|nr:C45 family peptidase [Chryseolinea sp.]